MKRKIPLMILTILILQVLLPVLTIIWESDFTIKSIAADTENSWDVSENQNGSITATFDNTTRTLTISGTGEMKNYGGSYSYIPWYVYQEDIRKVNISEGITNICNYAFYECENIISIVIPNSVTSIGASAFYNCSNLSNVQLSSNLTEIGTSAFSGCKSISNIQLPEGLITISPEVFKDCINLTNINIPNSVEMIGQEDHPQYGEYQFDVFRGCRRLESISVEENNANYSSVDGVLFNKDKSKLISYPEAKKTSEYTIPSSVTKVGAYSIYNVANVTKINIPNGVTAVGDGGFRGCINLNNINIPATLETLDNDVFDDCTELKNITVDENNANYSSVDGVLFNKDKTAILFYPIGKESTTYTIPNSVTTIGSGLFRGCDNLTRIEIPDSVVNIEWFAFSGCTGLTEITIPDSVNKMGSEIYGMHFGYIFEGCENLKSITLPAEIDTFYSSYAFKNCSSLEEIIIPEGAEYIGNEAFLGCSSLSSIELPESVISIHSSAFQGCSSLTSIEIPSFDPIIPGNSFHGTGLETLDIPDGITTIYTAFEKCRNLKQINIPETVTTISKGAFREALLTIKVETNSNESYEIELPEVIKRTMDSSDVLYSENGLYTYNCTLSDDKVIASKDILEQGKAKIKVKSGALWDLEVAFESTTYSDTEVPIIEDIYGVNYPSSDVFGIGDKVSIRIRTSEFMKGNPPKLKFRFGNGEERIAIVSYNWNTGSGTEIEYSYTVQDGDNGLLKVISFEGEELTDWSGNKLVKDNIPELDEMMVANTMAIEAGVIKEEYHITNKDELKNIQELVTLGTYDFSNSIIYLENDIDLECNENNQWIPIGTIYNTFKGTFEGNGHKITGLYINSEENYQGLFGYNSGTIKNVSLENSYIQSTGNYIGGITGCNYDKAIIENCHNGAEISGNYNVGGITGGNNNPYSGEIKIVNSCNFGKIEGQSSVGGIVGKTWINNFIDGCYNMENVSGDESVGGIIGSMPGDADYFSKVSNCYNTGTISSNRIVGGIVGHEYFGTSDIIEYCYNIGTIEGKGSSWFKGSIIGSGDDAIVRNCYYSNTSSIKAVQNEDDEENNVYGLSDEYMKSAEFVNLLNSGNEETVWKIGNDYYPYAMLNWQEYITILKGDANGDNEVNFRDILVINNHRLGKTQLTGDDLTAADVTGDGKIDFMDILQVNRYRLGKIDSL